MPARLALDPPASAGAALPPSLSALPVAGGAERRSLGLDLSGAIAIEFALVLPLLLIFCFVTVEIGRFAILHMKLEQVASVVGDLATRDRTLDVGTVDDIVAVADHVLSPFSLGADGVVVLSGIGAPDDSTPRVLWQRRGGGTGDPGDTLPGVGSPVSLPEGISATDGRTVVLAEVVYDYEPWLLGALTSKQLIKRAYFRPRLGSLDRLLP